MVGPRAPTGWRWGTTSRAPGIPPSGDDRTVTPAPRRSHTRCGQTRGMEQRRLLGSSGIEVGAVALGTMMFGAWGNSDRSECSADGRHGARRRASTLVRHGRHLRRRRVGGDRGRGAAPDAEIASCSPPSSATRWMPTRCTAAAPRRWVREAVTEQPPAVRQTDRIDLYQMHRPDPDVPFEETLGALARTGATRGSYTLWGRRRFPAEQLVESQWMAARGTAVRPAGDGATAVLGVLPQCVERAVFPTCRSYDVDAPSCGRR